MKLQHTQGPWTVEENIDGIYSGKMNLVYGQNGFICECSRQHRPFHTKDGGKANARLIAAAPEMLEVLIKQYKWLYSKAYYQTAELLKELIEKATGMSIEEVLSQ